MIMQRNATPIAQICPASQFASSCLLAAHSGGYSRPVAGENTHGAGQRRAVIDCHPGVWETSWCAAHAASGDRGQARSGEADVQDEVPDPQMQDPATGPVHNSRQRDDGQDDHDHPEEEHNDAGDGPAGDRSRSSHGHQLPTAAQLIRRVSR